MIWKDANFRLEGRQNPCRTIFRTKEISSGKGLHVAAGGGGDAGGGDFTHCAEDQHNLPEGSGLDWQVKLLCRCR